jgi:hypothetical protein
MSSGPMTNFSGSVASCGLILGIFAWKISWRVLPGAGASLDTCCWFLTRKTELLLLNHIHDMDSLGWNFGAPLSVHGVSCTCMRKVSVLHSQLPIRAMLFQQRDKCHSVAFSSHKGIRANSSHKGISYAAGCSCHVPTLQRQSRKEEKGLTLMQL